MAPEVAQNGSRNIVDMRSDTVTQPTPEMRAAMAKAEVGDDVMGEDPTINELQAKAATMFGKEAALFVPTGTMGNLASIMVHCQARGSEVILGSQCHIHGWEQGGIATIGGVHPRTLTQQPDGTMLLEDIEAAIRVEDDHFPTTRLVSLEQTHNAAGGRVLPLSYIDDVAALCKRRGLKLHIDGARIFNACVALGVSPERMVRDADSVSVCLSKGLASPVGSVILGTRDFIKHCKRVRKALGGGMRQAGVLAACGLLSLKMMSQPERLGEDHRRAKALAAGIADVPGLTVDQPESNLVFFTVTQPGLTSAEVKKKLKERGTLVGDPKPTRIRAALHYQIDDSGVAKAVAHFRAAMQELVEASDPPAKRQKMEVQ